MLGFGQGEPAPAQILRTASSKARPTVRRRSNGGFEGGGKSIRSKQAVGPETHPPPSMMPFEDPGLRFGDVKCLILNLPISMSLLRLD